MSAEMTKDDPEKITEDKRFWYGWGRLKPRFLQCFNRLGCYVPLIVAFQLMSGIQSSWFGTALQEIEKQFGLASTVTGTLATASDLGNTCTVIFVGYIGTKYSKVRGVAVGMFLLGVGTILNGLPHYLIEPYQPPEHGTNMTVGPPPVCPMNSSSLSPSIPIAKAEDSSPMTYFPLLLAGHIIGGIGVGPIYPLGLAYLDDNTDVATAAILIGLVTSCITIGGSLGFFITGPAMKYLYVDFDRVDTSNLPFDSESPKWIGAWWLANIVCGLFYVFLAIPVSGFPNLLPTSPLKDKEKPKNDASTNVLVYLKKTITDFFKSLFKLLFNLELTCLNVSSSLEGVAFVGMSLFLVKFVRHEYDMAYDVAGYVVGIKAIIGSGGYLIAGFITKCFKLDLLGMEKASVILYIVIVLLGLCLFAACPNIDMPGVERPYPGESAVEGLISECQGQCLCEGQSFNPVCGTDGLVYFSPCHAGCLNTTMEGGVQAFTNCSCVAVSQNVSVSDVLATATLGKCDVYCWQMYFVLPCYFFVFVLIMTSAALAALAVLRCVDQELKPFAIGLKIIFGRVLGSLPAPLVIGRIVDSACTVWSGSDSDTSRFCEMYDKQSLTSGIAIMWLVSGLVSLVFMLLCVLINICKRKKAEKKEEIGENGVDEVNHGNGDVKGGSNDAIAEKEVASL